MNSPLDESPERAQGDPMELIRELDIIGTPSDGDEWWDFGPDRVTVTATADVHAATEALIVCVRIWVDDETPERLDRVRWQAAQLRSAMEQGDQL